MSASLRIGLAQLSARVGDLAGNAERIRTARAALPEAEVILTPELGIVGYPPEDLVLKPALVEAAEAKLRGLPVDAAAEQRILAQYLATAHKRAPARRPAVPPPPRPNAVSR